MTNANIPALLGGNPVNAKPRPAYNTIGPREKAAVMEVLDSGELSGFVGRGGPFFNGGKQVLALEADICAWFGVKHAVSVNSATSALQCATQALCLEPGEEVIVSPYTMTASATSILYAGGIPVFADIETDTFGLDPVAVEAAITPRTRAIMTVNIFGHPSRLGPLKALANKYDLKLIEDNAQSPGAKYHGQWAGLVGDAGILSFNRHKTMQSGEGGVLLTNDDDIAMRARLLRNHGEVCVNDYNITDMVNTVGLNFRMSEMEAAVARVQFSRLEELTDPRVTRANLLTQGLSSLDGITPPKVEERCSHVYYVYCPRFSEQETGISRDLMARALSAEGFATRAGYIKPVYLEPMYQKKQFLGKGGYPFNLHPDPDTLRYEAGLCPTCEQVENSEVLMSDIIFDGYSEEDMHKFVEACDKVMQNKDSLLSWEAGQGRG